MSTKSKTPVYLAYNNQGHSPLALGMIVSYAKSYKQGLLDALYEFVPTLLTSVEVAQKVVMKSGPGIVLCSDYLWSSAGNLEVTEHVKKMYPQSITVHGGPSVPKYDYSCEEFFEENPGVDIAVRGEGELIAAELLEHLAVHPGGLPDDRHFLSDVPGITYRDKSGEGSKITRTEERGRILVLDEIPSPYLTGWFHNEDASKWWGAAIIETNRGCPYGCTFCDWGSATLSKVRKFALDRVQGEIEWIAKQGVEVLWIADANWGIFERDIEVARTIASCRRKYGNPRAVIVNYAKHGTERLAEMVGILQSANVAAGGIISIQTQDPQTLQNINRSNIKTQRYEDLIGVFRKNNLPVSSDLMIGLPGATVESFKSDLQFFFDRKVFAQAYPTYVLPNSPMAHRDYIEKFDIESDRNGEILSTSSYTRADRTRMLQIYECYRYMIGNSLLKFILYFLQMDHRIRIVNFIDDLNHQLRADPKKLPHTGMLIGQLRMEGQRLVLCRRTQDDWNAFYREIGVFAESKYKIADRAMETVLMFQALLMPEVKRNLPETKTMAYDVGGYFRELLDAANISNLDKTVFKRLSERGPGVIEISDPRGLCVGAGDVVHDTHQMEWELSWRVPTPVAID